MNSFLETYGKAIFTLVIITILIAFAGPLGIKIKNTTTDKVSQTEQIGKDEITVATGGTVRPAEPAEAVNQVYCIYYDDGEMTISQNKIEPKSGRTVVKKGFYGTPSSCTTEMITVRFEGIVKPKSCATLFYDCKNLKNIKNTENLYTNECKNMFFMFTNCVALTKLDLSQWDISKVDEDMNGMFAGCNSLQTKSIKVSQATFNKMNELVTANHSAFNYYIGQWESVFDIVK